MFRTQYIGVVTEVIDDDRRGIRAAASHMPDTAGIIYPLAGGIMQSPSPVKDDIVAIFQFDSIGKIRFYMPIYQDLALPIEDYVIETEGQITIGTAADAEYVALAPLVKGELDKVKSDIDALKLHNTTHVHPSPVGPTGPTANPLVLTWSPAEVAASQVKVS